MITGSQVRAARALLDWKQTDLAEKTGLSVPSINNIERMVGSPRLTTLNIVRDALQSEGIEFLDFNGVRRHSEAFEMKEFHGTDFINRLHDDLLVCLRGPEDEIVMYGLDDSLFPIHFPEEVFRWDEAVRTRKFRERALIKEGDTYILSNVESYRWIPREMIGLVPYYVYSDRIALIMWETRRVIIIRSSAIANSFRAQFELLWGMSKPIPNSKNKMDDPEYRSKLTKKKKK
jgi:transcriptional regulator with XRE-family HTH domain